MKAGPLRHRITIEQAGIEQDALGAPQKTWTTLTEVQAQIAFVSGREFFGSDRADLAECTTRIYLRETPDITLGPEMRVTDIDTGAVYDIVAVLPSHNRDMITLAARSGGKQP